MKGQVLMRCRRGSSRGPIGLLSSPVPRLLGPVAQTFEDTSAVSPRRSLFICATHSVSLRSKGRSGGGSILLWLTRPGKRREARAAATQTNNTGPCTKSRRQSKSRGRDGGAEQRSRDAISPSLVSCLRVSPSRCAPLQPLYNGIHKQDRGSKV